MVLEMRGKVGRRATALNMYVEGVGGGVWVGMLLCGDFLYSQIPMTAAL